MAFDDLMTYQGNAALGASHLIAEGAQFGVINADFSPINSYFDSLVQYNKAQWERRNKIADEITTLASKDQYHDLNGLIKGDQIRVMRAMEAYNKYMAENPEAYRPSAKNMEAYQKGRMLRKEYDDTYSKASKRSAYIDVLNQGKGANKYDSERKEYDKSIENVTNNWDASLTLPDIKTDLAGYESALTPIATSWSNLIRNPNDIVTVKNSFNEISSVMAGLSDKMRDNQKISIASEQTTSYYNRFGNVGAAAVAEALANNSSMSEEQQREVFYNAIGLASNKQTAISQKALVDNANRQIDMYNNILNSIDSSVEGGSRTIGEITGRQPMAHINDLDGLDEMEVAMMIAMSKAASPTRETAVTKTDDQHDADTLAQRAKEFDRQLAFDQQKFGKEMRFKWYEATKPSTDTDKTKQTAPIDYFFNIKSTIPIRYSYDPKKGVVGGETLKDLVANGTLSTQEANIILMAASKKNRIDGHSFDRTAITRNKSGVIVYIKGDKKGRGIYLTESDINKAAESENLKSGEVSPSWIPASD